MRSLLPDGYYAVGENVYVPAKKAEHFVYTGALCEGLYSGDEEWYPAEIFRVTEDFIPNTDLVIKRVHVKYAHYGNTEALPVEKIRFYMGTLASVMKDITAGYTVEKALKEAEAPKFGEWEGCGCAGRG